MLSHYGTEQVGISAEIAIADLTGVRVEAAYRTRGRIELINHIKPVLVPMLREVPKPIAHVAEDRNPVDFQLEHSATLSVKSNMRELGKVAPQNIGQPTALTFWSRLPHLVPAGVNVNSLTYAQSAQVFKQVAQAEIVELLGEYWRNLFDCDYTIFVYEVLDNYDNLSSRPKVKLFKKAQSPEWQRSRISFTQSAATWNESCTVKYGNISIGEFQIHANRNCFKFRFNLNGLIQAGLL
jgi:hypothetical protein